MFRRKGGRSFYFVARLERGRRTQLATRSSDPFIARQIVTMWERLARARAWDLTGRVVQGELRVDDLWDLWTAAEGDLDDVRRRLADVDLVPLVEAWARARQAEVPAAAVQRGEGHVRWLLGKRRLASKVTADWLTEQLAAYPGKRNTRRRVHSSWALFFGWCARVKRLFPANPMAQVDRPKLPTIPIAFHETADVERIVGAQPTEERRALYALLYGAGVEVSVALALRRLDCWPVVGKRDRMAGLEVRVAGTKTATRDRVAIVADWAWPIVWAHAKTMHPHAPLFPGRHRGTVHRWHRRTERDLGLPLLRVHAARHHWAVRAIRAGTPVELVSRQLGHGSSDMTLRVYGRFVPRSDERRRWEAEATKAEKRRAR